MAAVAVSKWLALIGITLWLFIGRPQPDTLVMLNVGAGLATLFTDHQGWQMLYDAGPGRAVLSELGRTLPPWDDSLDLLVISHAHRDHLEGAVAVLAAYQVKEVWLPHNLGDNDFTRALHEALEKERAVIVYPSQGFQRWLKSGWKITVWHPPLDISSDHAHAATIVISGALLSAPRWLLTGDLERANERAVLEYCTELPVGCATDILQVSHHGSRTTTQSDWLTLTRPKVALISTGENSYGHPHQETLDRLHQQKISFYRTDESGRLRLVLRWPLRPP